MPAFTPQRSALYVPASNQRAVDKSSSIDADWIIFDLEDSVASERKSAARDTLLTVFKNKDFGNSRTAIRCNAVCSEDFKDDMQMLAICCPDAVLLPKVESKENISKFGEIAETANLDKNISTWFMIETAKGIARLAEILESAKSNQWMLTTLVVGHNDIASDTGVALEFDRRYLIPWLMQIVLQAKANDLQVLDSVCNNFRDLAGFEKEAVQARQMGFDGKTLIHPTQVDIATRVFSPTKDEITRARKIIDAFLKKENLQKNVLNIDGEMVERLHLLQAENLLLKAGES